MTSKRSSFLPLLVAVVLAPITLYGETEESEASAFVESHTAAYQADVPFHRLIMQKDVTIRIKPLRLDSGKQIRLVYGIPKKAKNVPAVFILDVEANAMANQTGALPPGASKREKSNYRQTAYLHRSPFGSNMLGNGFAVAYIVADDLETLRSARTADWIGIFNRVRDLNTVDSNNVFLFSTREYANLSLFLASKYNFSGLILEEPTYMLFSRNSHEEVLQEVNQLSPDEIWSRTDPTREFVYEQVLGRISTPIMLIRNPDTRGYALNQKTLIPKLDKAQAYYETIEIRGAGRDLTVFGGNGDGVLEVAPRVSYYTPTVTKWVSEILSYMKVNSSIAAVPLR